MNEDSALDSLVKAIAKLPGLGPRSARRISLQLLTNKESVMDPLIRALTHAKEQMKICHSCGNLDVNDPCYICTSERRDNTQMCVLADVASLWAVERTKIFKGRYHILGGVLSALDGIGPEDLKIGHLVERIHTQQPAEIILALSATVDGQATAHYLMDRIEELPYDIKITRLAHGVPIGGELDYLDEGTIVTAIQSRSAV